MIRLALVGVLIALTACGSTPPEPAPRTPIPPEFVETPGPTPVAPPVVIAPSVAAAPSMPPELRVRPPVSGQGILLFMGATARVDTIAITFARSARKEVGRTSTGLFDFVFTKGGKKVELHLETQQEKFQAEVVAHGSLFVFEHRSDEVFTVVLAAATAPSRLEEPACVELIDQAAKRAGITDRGSTGYGSVEGILRVRRDSWTANCGRYTKRVWFGP